MSRMLIVMTEFKCSNGIFAIVPNVYIRPNSQQKEADAAKAKLSVPDGDYLSFLNVYNNCKQSTPVFP